MASDQTSVRFPWVALALSFLSSGVGHIYCGRIAKGLFLYSARFLLPLLAKIEHLLAHRRHLPELARLGCLFIVSAVESLSDTVLAILDKGHTRADVVTALRLTREAGITLRPSLLPFTPWSSLHDYHELIAFIAAEDLVDHVDPVQLAIRLLIPPGSLLEGRQEVQPFLGALDRERFTYRWSHPDARMDRLHLEVSALVEEAAGEGDDPETTFGRIAAAATAMERHGMHAGDAVMPLRIPPLRRDREKPPRLTESWFC